MFQYVRINDTTEVQHFIRDLKNALKRAEQQGGGYSAFLHNDNGNVILQVEVAPIVRPRK